MSIKASRFSGGPGTTNGGFNMKIISLAASALALSVAFAGSAFAENILKLESSSWGTQFSAGQYGGNNSINADIYANNTWVDVHQKGDNTSTSINKTSLNTQGGDILNVTQLGTYGNDFTYGGSGDTAKVKVIQFSEQGKNTASFNANENVATNLALSMVGRDNFADIKGNGITTNFNIIQMTTDEYYAQQHQ
jgi:hypothetical protein